MTVQTFADNETQLAHSHKKSGNPTVHAMHEGDSRPETERVSVLTAGCPRWSPGQAVGLQTANVQSHLTSSFADDGNAS